MKHVFAIIAVACVAGCSGATGAAEDVARDAAKRVVNGAVESQFPQFNASVVTDCIIDNATMPEVFAIARDTLTTPSAETATLVAEIAGRPATLECFAEKGTALLAG
jgi:hypothetical protein